MAENWQALQTDIANDLRNDGQAFVFVRPGRGEYDPIKGQYAEAVEEQFTAYGIFKSLGTLGISSMYSFAWQQETSIRTGDKVLLLDGAGYTPQAGDFLVFNDQKWSVVSWAFLDPSGLPLLLYLLVRRA